MIEQSFKIKDIDIKNRICVPPLVIDAFGDENGFVTQAKIKHYKDMAAGGPGLVIQEATAVTQEGRLSFKQIAIWDDKYIDGLKKITEAVHACGVPIFVQIHHAGVSGVNDRLLCPSAYTLRGNTGVEMTREEIIDIEQAFIDAARRAHEAGYDGVELHGCHSYLICQFLNGRVNKRTDEYGQDKTLFAKRIIAGIKKVVPASFVVGVRVGAFEPTLEDALANAKELEAAGCDFFDVSYGFSKEHEPFAPQGSTVKDVIFAAGEIKKACKIPVFAVNGINSPEVAEHVLAATGVDMVDIGRGVLVDYNWANKALSGKKPGVCIGCATCMWRTDEPFKCPGRLAVQKTEGK